MLLAVHQEKASFTAALFHLSSLLKFQLNNGLQPVVSRSNRQVLGVLCRQEKEA